MAVSQPVSTSLTSSRALCVALPPAAGRAAAEHLATEARRASIAIGHLRVAHGDGLGASAKAFVNHRNYWLWDPVQLGTSHTGLLKSTVCSGFVFRVGQLLRREKPV